MSRTGTRFLSALGRFSDERPWSHNDAYTPFVLWHARKVRRGAAFLDVGCGTGTLLRRLAGLGGTVVGLEPDARTAARARANVDGLRNVVVREQPFDLVARDGSRYDFVSFVASLHHLPLTPTLEAAPRVAAAGRAAQGRRSRPGDSGGPPVLARLGPRQRLGQCAPSPPPQGGATREHGGTDDDAAALVRGDARSCEASPPGGEDATFTALAVRGGLGGSARLTGDRPSRPARGLGHERTGRRNVQRGFGRRARLRPPTEPSAVSLRRSKAFPTTTKGSSPRRSSNSARTSSATSDVRFAVAVTAAAPAHCRSRNTSLREHPASLGATRGTADRGGTTQARGSKPILAPGTLSSSGTPASRPPNKTSPSARSLRDAKDIVDELTAKDVELTIGGSVHDLNDLVGRLLFNVLAVVAEFELDLIRVRTREGMQIAEAKRHLRGRQPELSVPPQRHLLEVHEAGTHSVAELAELFGIGRATVYRCIDRQAHPDR